MLQARSDAYSFRTLAFLIDEEEEENLFFRLQQVPADRP